MCYSGGERAEAWWGLLGVGVLIVVAGAIFLAQPWWSRRREHLTELTGADDADLVRRLEGVRQQAGTVPLVWLLQPLNTRLSAFAFGRPGRRFVAVSGGAAVAAVRKPAAFEAVILHELAHIKNRDIDQTYLALAIWRAFVVAALLPLAVVLIVSRVLGEPQLLIWRMALLALIVYSLRNAILRSREFDADARARQIDPRIALDTVLASLPARTGRRVWHLGWKHPSGRERAAALADPAPLYRFGFWDGLAIGLVAALGASAAHEIVTLVSTTVGIHWVVPAIIFAAFAGPAVAVAMWRRQSLEADTGGVKGWAAGLGLGLGLAVGPVIVPLAAYSQALAPDHPSPAAVGVFVVWIVLAVVIFTPFPVWVGHWADAWQQRPGRTESRVPARGAMVAAALAAWAVMAIGLYLLLENFTDILDQSSAADEWHGLPELLRSTAIVIAQAWSGWVVCLLVVGMPLAAAVAHWRWRRPGHTADATVRRRWLAPALLGLAGCLATIALMLAVSALAHARVAEVVRWSLDFVSRARLLRRAGDRRHRGGLCADHGGEGEIRRGCRALGRGRGRGGGGRRPGDAQRVEHGPLLCIAQHRVRPSAGLRLPDQPGYPGPSHRRARCRPGKHPFRACRPRRGDRPAPSYPAGASAGSCQGARVARGRRSGRGRSRRDGPMGSQRDPAGRQALRQHRQRRLDPRIRLRRSPHTGLVRPAGRPAGAADVLLPDLWRANRAG